MWITHKTLSREPILKIKVDLFGRCASNQTRRQKQFYWRNEACLGRRVLKSMQRPITDVQTRGRSHHARDQLASASDNSVLSSVHVQSRHARHSGDHAQPLQPLHTCTHNICISRNEEKMANINCSTCITVTGCHHLPWHCPSSVLPEANRCHSRNSSKTTSAIDLRHTATPSRQVAALVSTRDLITGVCTSCVRVLILFSMPEY